MLLVFLCVPFLIGLFFGPVKPFLRVKAKEMKNMVRWSMLLSLIVYTGGCSKSDDEGGAGNVDSDISVFETNFPVQLAVASPTDVSGTGTFNTFSFMTVDPANVAYSNALTRINEVLTGEAAILDTYTPNLFLQPKL